MLTNTAACSDRHARRTQVPAARGGSVLVLVRRWRMPSCLESSAPFCNCSDTAGTTPAQQLQGGNSSAWVCVSIQTCIAQPALEPECRLHGVRTYNYELSSACQMLSASRAECAPILQHPVCTASALVQARVPREPGSIILRQLLTGDRVGTGHPCGVERGIISSTCLPKVSNGPGNFRCPKRRTSDGVIEAVQSQ
jgi:hypothetical protein